MIAIVIARGLLWACSLLFLTELTFLVLFTDSAT